MCAPVAPSGAALTPCSSRVSRARERAVWRSGAARCGPRVRLTGRGLFCCSGAGILLRTQEAVSSAPSAGGALPWGLESSRWGAVLSCRCLIPFLSRPPALPDSFSKNKSPSPPPSLALSQLSSQGGEVGVKAPLELPRAAARGPGGGGARSSQTTAHGICPVAGLGLACDADCNTFFFSWLPFLPDKISFIIYFKYLFI